MTSAETFAGYGLVLTLIAGCIFMPFAEQLQKGWNKDAALGAGLALLCAISPWLIISALFAAEERIARLKRAYTDLQASTQREIADHVTRANQMQAEMRNSQVIARNQRINDM